MNMIRIVPRIYQRLSRERSSFKRIAERKYSTRKEHESPFARYPFRKPPFINWKTTGIFFLLGSYLAYNETLFDVYESFTNIDEGNEDLLTTQLEYKLKQVPIYQELNHPKQKSKWIQLRTWENLDHNVIDKSKVAKSKCEEEYAKPSITNEALAKPGGFLIQPVIFFNTETNESVTIAHVGHRLCGYPFIIHGGVTATLLNESFKRNASLSNLTTSNLKDDFKVEKLKINYKFPVFANQFIVLKIKPEAVSKGKHIELTSTIESKSGKILVKGEAELQDTGRASKAITMSKRWKIF
ncbi:uncharacterized protein PRCAT00000353001 [Priceomyces carsonii]|uniref:uncharacterized protein n=1 Tax=Priceomyces carsonii TaxID=28549 RepID=UPI002EDA63A6|nr:unnamed protein product [Priceomyces carsonii]